MWTVDSARATTRGASHRTGATRERCRAITPSTCPNRPQLETCLQAIPGSAKLVGVAACHHGQFYGSLILIDPNVADDDKMAQVRRITPEARFPECEVGSGDDNYYSTPWPLSEEFFLCVYSPTARAGKYGIYLVDAFGNRELLYTDPAISCLCPIPPAPARAARHTGENHTAGQNRSHGGDERVQLAPAVPRQHKIKALRLVQVLPNQRRQPTRRGLATRADAGPHRSRHGAGRGRRQRLLHLARRKRSLFPSLR